MIFRLIKKHFLENKVVFIVFVLCQIVSLLIALFIFNLSELKDRYAEYSTSIYRTISVTCDENETEKGINFNLLSKSGFVDSIETIDSKLLVDNNLLHVVLYSTQDCREVIDAGRGISTEDIEDGKYVAVVNPKIKLNDEALSVGDSFELLGDIYNVVGFSSSISGIMIPANESVISKIGRVNIVYKSNLSDKEAADLMDEIKREFDSATVTKVAEAPVETFKITTEDIMIALTLVLVNINFVSLYLYMLDRDKYTLAIFKMSGCSIKKANRILIGEVGVVCGLAFILALSAFNLFGRNIYNFMNPMLLYTFSAKATSRTLIAYLFSIALVFLPTIVRHNKNTPYQVYSQEEI